MTDQPQFRFHPDAYRRVFIASNEQCDVCRLPAGWLYQGNIYAISKPNVCARCIADGRLATRLGVREFSFFDTDFDEGVDATLVEEILTRTPGFPCFNPFRWPAIDGKPLAFFGYGDEDEVWNNLDARAAMIEAFGEFKLDSPTPYALVFKQVDGPLYTAVVDLD